MMPQKLPRTSARLALLAYGQHAGLPCGWLVGTGDTSRLA